jgi:hypothetical protein
MQGGAVVQPDTTRRLLLAVMACVALAGTGLIARAQRGVPPPPGASGAEDPELVRVARNVPGDSKPIILHADAITTWTDNGRVVLLLQGQVLVEQGVLQARFQQGVVWVDVQRKKRSGILHADLYAEGDVRLQNAAETSAGPRALVDLNTRGELRLFAHQSKVVQQARADDPLYLRARAEATPPPAPSPIQRTAGQEPGLSTGGAPGLPVQGTPPFPGPPNPGMAAPPAGGPVSPGGGSPPPAAAPPFVVPPPPPSPGPGPPPASAPGPPAAAGPAAGGLPPETAPQPRRVPGAAAAPPGSAPPRVFSIAPRTAAPFQQRLVNLPNGEQALIVTGGVILHVRNVERIGLLDIEADRLVLWSKGNVSQQLINGMNRPEGHTGQALEFYLAGHVELREQDDPRPVPTPGEAPPGSAPRQPAPTDSTAPTGPAPPGNPNAGQPPVVRSQAPAADQPADNTAPAPIPGPPATATPSRDPSGPTPAAGQRPDRAVVPPPGQNRPPVTRTLRCDEVYYDVSRNVALALNATLEVKQAGFPDPIYFQGVEIEQLSPTDFRGKTAKLFSSRLPSDPGLDATFQDATLHKSVVVKRGLFGPVIDRKTGQPVTEERDDVVAEGVFFRIEQVPFFYLPYAKFDAHDPLGPLQDVSIGYNTVFGFEASATFNVFDLIGVQPPVGMRWQVTPSYLSSRGPALGTNFDATEGDFFGLPAKAVTYVKAFGIKDDGTDQLGGGRGQFDNHPEWRGRLLFRENVQDLPDGFSFQAQASALSDKNFLEQYFKLEFDDETNQETFLYVKQQPEGANYAWTALAQPHLRDWVTETQWLPRADAYLIGQSFFDRLVYNAWASAGYAQLDVTHVPPPPVCPTDVSVTTGRFDLTQELSWPFYAGPVKMVPYGTLDLTYYTSDLYHQDLGRVIGGAGLMASIPFTRLYPDVQSDWFNLNAINHKIVLTGNYYVAQSSSPVTSVSQLDRINDDATDQALRDIKPLEPLYIPGPAGGELAHSPLFDPQLYAIRQLVDNRIDTRDSIEVLELDVRQRLQTKRGYPGLQHTVDWMTLDVSAWLYPDSHRDDFGHTLGFVQYDWVWNVGDRNGFVSSGWFEPFNQGASVWNFGAFFDRTDKTSVYLGYRQIDPVDSRLAIASLTTVLSPKYAIGLSTSYDFGTNQQTNAVTLTRIGTDVQVSVGFNYNSTTNNVGFQFLIVPNAVAQTRRSGAVQAIAPGAGLLGAH